MSMAVERKENISGPSDKAAFAFVQALAQEMSGGKIEIPSFPDVAVRIRQVLADENCNAAQVAKVIGAEPGMSAKILQMANSAALNTAGVKINDLKGAVARIGFANVRTVSLAYAMQQIRNAPALAPIRQPLNELWAHSVKMASLAFVAARRWSNVNRDQALLAGLMHGVGKVYILARSTEHPDLFNDPARFQQILNDWHAPIAKAVLESWDISRDIVEAVGAYEELDRRGEFDPDLIDVLTIAERLVSTYKDPEVMEAALAEAGASKRMGLTSESVQKVLKETADELASLNAALGG
jgi:HD-like signal output (HDOD) protein